MKRWLLLTSIALTAAIMAGCATLDEQQRSWIFQPSAKSWGGSSQLASSMTDTWIEFDSTITDESVKLHGLWWPADKEAAFLPTLQTALPNNSLPPLLLYLHGARWNVEGSAARIARMQSLGFSVLAIDYRGFGKSSAGLPSEKIALEDARAAWDWLAKQYPGRPRYIFGHSLGGAIAIELAASVDDEAGTIVEGTFTSIADVLGTTKWGWLPLKLLITQPFDSIDKVANIGSPLLVVHGSNDQLILPSLGRKLYDAAAQPKAFVLVEGGSHHNTNALGMNQYRQALTSLFGGATSSAYPEVAAGPVATQ
ncbi:hypothetical protein HC248_01598 [Polaromonas vacuolata]|uniref:Serine aminopeptidase S33 domain-containing protein n=1 Tax=Polaromonas vacuolata TaxID=37448 RepID=A0A6H2H9Y5_9BURK|nr:alpha/beta fold hydrolase [Polaromonas vacuolata]QJC56296.1 hypothetical protein HC248_01598 [Polaromonas vacuolata]